MSSVDLGQLIKDVRDLVRQAKRAGNLEQLTPRLVIDGLEESYDLEPGTLKRYKAQLKEAMHKEAAADESAGEDPLLDPLSPEPVKPVAKKARAPAKSKAKEQKAPTAQARDEDELLSSPPATKVRKPRKKVIAESEDEYADGPPAPSPPSSMSKLQSSSPNASVKRGASPEVNTEAGPSSKPPAKRRKVVKDEDEEVTSNPPTSNDKAPESGEPIAEEVTKAEASESEMSVLIDTTPVKKKGKGKGKEKAPPREKKSKSKATADGGEKKASTKGAKASSKAKEAGSPDDETIKRLKGLVVACGVRKPWVREFADKPKPSQQIAHLRSILADLGLGPRAGLEQARAVRAKRELAQELADVQEFESRHARGRRGGGGEETAKRKAAKKVVVESDDEGGGDEDEASEDEKPKPSARNKIMAFLADQSDDE